jgi:tetratricopeptide (TPR) repeat protein
VALNRLLLRAQHVVPAPSDRRFADRGVIQATPPLTAWLAVSFQQPPGAIESPEAKEKARIEKLIEDARAALKAEDPQRAVRLKKWIDEAEVNLLKLDKASNEVRGQGYMLLGRVLSETGKRTEGLKAYLRGLKMFHPEAELDQLLKLVDNHPAFIVPESLSQPNPALAEVHYGEGIHLYFERKYGAAEAEFLRALTYNQNDARYLYYLGLTQLAQSTGKKKEQAEFNFERAARLEIQNLPGTDEVNTSLERIQGPLRQTLNGYRRKVAQTVSQ